MRTTVDPRVRFDNVESAIIDLAAGKAVILTGDQDRGDQGDILFAAATATPELMAWAIRHSSGLITVAMTADRLDRLGIAASATDTSSAYTISVDFGDATTTGISAVDRARTVRALAEGTTCASALTRPGHIFPVRYRQGGVLRHRSRIEAAIDLTRPAAPTQVGVLTEVINDDGTTKSVRELRDFADTHHLAMICIGDLVKYRWRHERLVSRVAQARLPTRHGVFTLYGYRNAIDNAMDVALIHGDLDGSGDEPVPVHIHAEQLIADVFGAHDLHTSAHTVDDALAHIASHDRGIVVYLRDYGHQWITTIGQRRSVQQGGNTQRALLQSDEPSDARYGATAAQILLDLRAKNVRLFNTRARILTDLRQYGVRITNQTLPTEDEQNHRADRSG